MRGEEEEEGHDNNKSLQACEVAQAPLLEWTVENGGKRIKTKTMTGNIAGACVCSRRIEFN